MQAHSNMQDAILEMCVAYKEVIPLLLPGHCMFRVVVPQPIHSGQPRGHDPGSPACLRSASPFCIVEVAIELLRR